MTNFTQFFRSTIGRKLLMGFTGLFLCSFLVVHFAGNLLLFRSDNGVAFNQYAEFMASNPAIRTMEIGLFLGLMVHIALGIRLWLANRRVRPEQYKVNAGSDTSSLASRVSFLSGSILFIFLVIHLRTFFVPSRFSSSEVSMYHLVQDAFASPLYSLFYLVALALLGYHLRHGFQSAFQTFGLRGKRYLPLIEMVGFIFWFLIPLGFAAMPLFFYFGLS
ncbi:MAG: succinate dehydrogenase cytochrome b subunit [Ignavibacteria bacterium]|nr:succinate dehydrogenase cytochrome b subunit [Ignavibacteria bacterium]